MTRQQIRSTDLRKYRTELPNLYDDLGLDPYEFRLLAHYARVGDCWESVRTTGQKCRMGIGKVSEVRRALEARGLISVRESARGTLHIRVMDLWPENFARYAGRAPAEESASGEKESGEARPAQRKPSQQDIVRRQAEAAFIASTRLQVPGRKSEAGELWWYPLREICQLAGWEAGRAERLIQRAVTRLRADGLTVSSPKSILKTARAIAAELESGPIQGGRERASDWEARVFGG